jgi:hypothetical protein
VPSAQQEEDAMTLDTSRERETQDVPVCRFCGGELDLGYHYTCHICDAAYCYTHMSRHMRAHSPNSQGKTSVPPDAGESQVLQAPLS